jgi:hypothetical protein
MSMNAREAIIGLSTCMALQMTSFVIILPLFALRFNELGEGAEALGISAMAYALTSTLAAPFIVLAFFKNYILIAITFVIAGLGNALYYPAFAAA